MGRLLAIAFALSMPVVVIFAVQESALACGGERYTSGGVIAGIATDRRSVSIAHGVISGLLTPQTTSFEVENTALLDGFKVADRVRFEFTLTDGGRKIVDRIGKDPSK